MATQPDFWGDIGPTVVQTPVAILREQAALLGTKTQHLVEAKVDTTVSAGSFFHSFTLVVPTLDNYTYELFSIRHGVGLYPVVVPGPVKDPQTEGEFKDWLRQRLSSPETKKIIGNLLAQVSS